MTEKEIIRGVALALLHPAVPAFPEDWKEPASVGELLEVVKSNQERFTQVCLELATAREEIEEAAHNAEWECMKWCAAAICAMCREGRKPVRMIMGRGFLDSFRHGESYCQATPIHRRLFLEEQP